MLQRFIILPLCCYMLYNLLQRQKAFIIFVDVDGIEVMGIFFFFETSTKSFIYHGWTLNLDKVFGWWSYFFAARPIFNCIYTRMYYSSTSSSSSVYALFPVNSWVHLADVRWHNMWKCRLHCVQSIRRKKKFTEIIVEPSVQDTTCGLNILFICTKWIFKRIRSVTPLKCTTKALVQQMFGV